MTEVDTGLAAGLCLALAVSFGNWRAWGWLLAIACSYVVSTIYWRSGMPYGAFIAGMCDATVCLGLYHFARVKWELWVWRLFQFSVAVNLIYSAMTIGVIASRFHNEYSVILETVNWIALAFIGGSGAMPPIGAHDVDPADHSIRGRFLRLVRPLYELRAASPWHQVPR